MNKLAGSLDLLVDTKRPPEAALMPKIAERSQGAEESKVSKRSCASTSGSRYAKRTRTNRGW